jgi:voltage-gated potassium channel
MIRVFKNHLLHYFGSKEKLKNTLKTNLIEILGATLLLTWLIIAWFVYKVESPQPDANITSYGTAVWWGIVTLLTVGYGDYYPITVQGRFLASILMSGGVLSVAILTSKICSNFLGQVLAEGRGRVNTALLEDHFIVCGWKEEMQELLHHILDFNPNLSPKSLVLIANLNPVTLDALKSDDRLKGLQVVVGNYYEAVNLERAAPQRAKKILILADRTPNAAGAIPSMIEVDSRTIMTAMALSHIARGTFVAAEILDQKMDQYLKLASVTEVIYSREYSRLLLGNASGGTGITNIIFDLLDPKTPTTISTKNIPEEWVGQEYSKFKEFFEKKFQNINIIGILENTGNHHSIKEMALKEAQKEPNVARLVENLKSIKNIKCNHPIFNPLSTYIIHAGSMAITIGTRTNNSHSQFDPTSFEDGRRLYSEAG